MWLLGNITVVVAQRMANNVQRMSIGRWLFVIGHSLAATTVTGAALGATLRHSRGHRRCRCGCWGTGSRLPPPAWPAWTGRCCWGTHRWPHGVDGKMLLGYSQVACRRRGVTCGELDALDGVPEGQAVGPDGVSLSPGPSQVGR